MRNGGHLKQERNSICRSWKVYSSVGKLSVCSCMSLCMTSLGFSMFGDLELLLKVDIIRSCIGWTIVLVHLILLFRCQIPAVQICIHLVCRCGLFHIFCQISAFRGVFLIVFFLSLIFSSRRFFFHRHTGHIRMYVLTLFIHPIFYLLCCRCDLFMA